MDCIVLAGGRPAVDHPLYGESRGAPKALLDVAGRPMIEWVLGALRAARSIDRIVVVGLNPGHLGRPAGTEVVRDRGSLVANLYAGIERLERDTIAAFCWSDIPLVRAAMIDRYVVAADQDADVHAGLVPRRLILERWPAHAERWIRLPEGRFVAADFGIFRTTDAARVEPHLRALAPRRKHVWRQALQIGLPLLIRYASGRLTMGEAERRIGARYDLRVRISEVPDVELGLDVDDDRDLALVRRVLARGAESTG